MWIFFIFFILFISSAEASKLFVISFPDNYGKVGKEKIFYTGLAEPAFGVIYDLKPPKNFFLLSPNNQKTKLTLLRTQYKDKAFNIKRIGYKTQVIPQQKGDYFICIESDYYLTRELILVKSLTKLPFHVQIEKGWDNLCGFELEIKPYTRPYGLSNRDIFWGQVLYNNKPLDSGIVEFERFSPVFLNLEDLPKDSYGEINYPYLKKTVKLNKNGFFVVSFNQPGWWVITIKKKAGVKSFGNELYPVELRHHLWLYIYPSDKTSLPFNYNFLKAN